MPPIKVRRDMLANLTDFEICGFYNDAETKLRTSVFLGSLSIDDGAKAYIRERLLENLEKEVLDLVEVCDCGKMKLASDCWVCVGCGQKVQPFHTYCWNCGRRID